MGLLLPRVLKPLYLVWMSLASVLGYFVSRIILTILYFLVITPIGLFMRLLGKDILDKKMDSKQSYWHRRANQSNDPARLEKMY
ncbi:hypothetical protein X474_03070 [Dethiosulfatarculus sandiegensis]|uniref:Uncharacterized protein n=1 Tax=Dethiosulfatarculus sandiegensis TaxID=1429043 RepID=A0A0D2JBW9_9BACT|nr:hypothetical protein X474_03070 [Dethiosulfatarculus sandiegensis]